MCWVAALQEADKGNLEPLIALFLSQQDLGPKDRMFIADLLDRHNLKKKPGRQAIPAYRTSKSEAILSYQKHRYKAHRDDRKPVDKAVEAALIDYKRLEWEWERENSGPPPTDEELAESITDDEYNRLENYVQGRRGSSRRKPKSNLSEIGDTGFVEELKNLQNKN